VASDIPSGSRVASVAMRAEAAEGQAPIILDEIRRIIR
jgi:hypothetical protein